MEACAHVAAGRAHEIPAYEQHQLRSGHAGTPQRVRADGGRAWRLSLQANTPSARRMHFWVVPGTDGRVVEFDRVGLHDDDI